MPHTFNMVYIVCNQTPPSPNVPVLDGQLPSGWLRKGILEAHTLYMTQAELNPKPVLPPGFHISEDDTITRKHLLTFNLEQLSHPGLLPISYSHN